MATLEAGRIMRLRKALKRYYGIRMLPKEKGK